jgi:hypothetical protein
MPSPAPRKQQLKRKAERPPNRGVGKKTKACPALVYVSGKGYLEVAGGGDLDAAIAEAPSMHRFLPGGHPSVGFGQEVSLPEGARNDLPGGTTTLFLSMNDREVLLYHSAAGYMTVEATDELRAEIRAAWPVTSPLWRVRHFGDGSGREVVLSSLAAEPYKEDVPPGTKALFLGEIAQRDPLQQRIKQLRISHAGERCVEVVAKTYARCLGEACKAVSAIGRLLDQYPRYRVDLAQSRPFLQPLYYGASLEEWLREVPGTLRLLSDDLEHRCMGQSRESWLTSVLGPCQHEQTQDTAVAVGRGARFLVACALLVLQLLARGSRRPGGA